MYKLYSNIRPIFSGLPSSKLGASGNQLFICKNKITDQEEILKLLNTYKAKFIKFPIDKQKTKVYLNEYNISNELFLSSFLYNTLNDKIPNILTIINIFKYKFMLDTTKLFLNTNDIRSNPLLKLTQNNTNRGNGGNKLKKTRYNKNTNTQSILGKINIFTINDTKDRNNNSNINNNLIKKYKNNIKTKTKLKTAIKNMQKYDLYANDFFAYSMKKYEGDGENFIKTNMHDVRFNSYLLSYIFQVILSKYLLSIFFNEYFNINDLGMGNTLYETNTDYEYYIYNINNIYYCIKTFGNNIVISDLEQGSIPFGYFKDNQEMLKYAFTDYNYEISNFVKTLTSKVNSTANNINNIENYRDGFSKYNLNYQLNEYYIIQDIVNIVKTKLQEKSIQNTFINLLDEKIIQQKDSCFMEINPDNIINFDNPKSKIDSIIDNLCIINDDLSLNVIKKINNKDELDKLISDNDIIKYKIIQL